MTTRRAFLSWSFAAALVGVGGALSSAQLAAAEGASQMTVYKNPACGCCGQWAGYVERAGFEAKVIDKEDLQAIKRMARVPDDLAACHTAIIGGYTVEGHVPVEAIRELLATRPEVFGIAVPGMPAGSPGMGGTLEGPLEVIAFSADGNRRLFGAF